MSEVTADCQERSVPFILTTMTMNMMQSIANTPAVTMAANDNGNTAAHKHKHNNYCLSSV